VGTGILDPMKDDVIDDAVRLGERIASHPRTEALKTASAEVQSDPAARRLQEDYSRELEDFREREATGRPIEPEQKRRLASLGDDIRRSAPLQRLLKAHADFAEMMDGVQRAISHAVDGALGMEPEEDDGEHEHGPGCDHGPAPSGGGRILVP
jgi:cell fate (sporulation/competence/biofilm development) regulator YlbF (YheA/YmcA/DUF963 family)